MSDRDCERADEILDDFKEELARVLTLHDYAYLRMRIARAIKSEREYTVAALKEYGQG